MTFGRFIHFPLIRRGAWIEHGPDNSRALWFELTAEGFRLAVGRGRIILDCGDYRSGAAY